VESTHDDLRGPVKTVESLNDDAPQVDSHRSSPDEGVTERVTPPQRDVVTVPVVALAVLVRLARFNDDETIAGALAAIAHASNDDDS
jgi:hypothetical protein